MLQMKSEESVFKYFSKVMMIVNKLSGCDSTQNPSIYDTKVPFCGVLN